MYVPRLKKILIFVVVLEERGYDVAFSKGKYFMKHVATIQVKQIGVRVKSLYKLEVDACATLSRKVEHVQSRDVGELWHRHIGHLHHGALKSCNKSPHDFQNSPVTNMMFARDVPLENM